jgi:hypothetical protein
MAYFMASLLNMISSEILFICNIRVWLDSTTSLTCKYSSIQIIWMGSNISLLETYDHSSSNSCNSIQSIAWLKIYVNLEYA